ncbi:hypothetical protein [Georgenia sp. AZ-5]|uniref:hypothetical protein n=1 Tax=Georgenia sp. AZ-5 TaxID=3367526 RepID=UPI003754367A
MTDHSPGPVDAVLELATAALAGHGGPGPVVVGIDGRSGSGKSGLAASVVAALRERPGLEGPGAVGLLALEDAYRGWYGLGVGVGVVAAQVLEPLSRGLRGAVRRYDWAAGAVDGVMHVPPPDLPLPRVLVVEGCGAGSRACAPFVDVLVWLEAPEPERRRRAMARDGGSWAHLWDAWAAQEQALLDGRDAPGVADLVLRTA